MRCGRVAGGVVVAAAAVVAAAVGGDVAEADAAEACDVVGAGVDDVGIVADVHDDAAGDGSVAVAGDDGAGGRG